MQCDSVDLLQVSDAAVWARITSHCSGYSPQFHWQNYNDDGYLTALHHLRDLQCEGKISAIGLCNFDSARTDEICQDLGPGIIVSNQVQV